MRPASRARTLAGAAGLSGLALVPVFWQPRVISSDLTSHTYNAWLAQLVEQGTVTGLEVVPQATNVLFDLVLAFLLRYFDAPTTERIAVSAAVLFFFWGAWWFLRAVRSSVDPAAVAILLAVTHGWVLQQGLLNYYLAVAASLWFLGFAWQRGLRGFVAGAPFLLLAVVGNPLPPLWAVSLIAFLAGARRFPGVPTWVGLLAAATGVRAVLSMPGWPVEFWWRSDQALYATGADQLIVFSAGSIVPAVVLLTHWLHELVTAIRGSGVRALAARPEFQALVATVLCVLVLPAGFRIPDHDSLVSFIPQRQSLAVIVLAVATFGPWGSLRPMRIAAFGIAASYFALLFADHGRVMDIERQVARELSAVPAGTRVIGAAQYHNTRVLYQQLVERACTGRCWSYGNYEPSSGQFRLRVTAANPVVMADPASVRDVHLGRHVVRQSDLPVRVLENCAAWQNRFCLRNAQAGDTAGVPRR